LYEATVKGEDIMMFGKVSIVIPNWLSVCQVFSDVGLLYCQTVTVLIFQGVS